jgi:hypothetical protein
MPSLGFPLPSLLASVALMCLAGEGGRKGLLKNLLGVDLIGDGDNPVGWVVAKPSDPECLVHQRGRGCGGGVWSGPLAWSGEGITMTLGEEICL